MNDKNITRLIRQADLQKISAITWTLKQIAPVIMKISKSSGEKTGEEMINEFWESIADDSPDKVATLDRYWQSFVTSKIRGKYNIPAIIRRIKARNPKIRGQKFYDAVIKRLVFENSPWLQLYYDVYYATDIHGNVITVESLQTKPTWPKIQAELIKTYYPLGVLPKRNISYYDDVNLTDKMKQILDSYDSDEYKDQSGKINSICIVWQLIRNTLKPAQVTNNPAELLKMVSEWKNYMQYIYDELKDIPRKYVTVYDQHQCDVFLHDREHYYGISPNIIRLFHIQRADPDKLIYIRYNSSHVYNGLRNLYLAAKGKAIQPFDMTIDKDFEQYKQDKLDKSFQEQSRLKQKSNHFNDTSIDKFGYVNALNILIDDGTFNAADFSFIYSAEDLINVIASIKNKLKSKYIQLKDTTDKVYAYSDNTLNKLFTNVRYGNIDQRAQFAVNMAKLFNFDFNKIFSGSMLWNCILSIQADMNGSMRKVNLPSTADIINEIVFRYLKAKNIFSLEACKDIENFSEFQNSINYFKQLVRNTYRKVLNKTNIYVDLSKLYDIDTLCANTSLGNVTKFISDFMNSQPIIFDDPLTIRIRWKNSFNPDALYMFIQNIYNYVLHEGNIAQIIWTTATTAFASSRLKGKKYIVAVSKGRPKSDKVRQRIRKEIFDKVNYWLNKHHLIDQLPDIADTLFALTEDKSIVTDNVYSGKYQSDDGDLDTITVTKTGLQKTDIDKYLTACTDIQKIINQYNLDELQPDFVQRIWNDINEGGFAVPFNWLKTLQDRQSIQQFEDANNQFSAKNDMSLIGNKYGILIHPKWANDFRCLADAAHTDTSDAQSISFPEVEILHKARDIFNNIINKFSDLMHQSEFNTKEGRQKYYQEQDRIFITQIHDIIPDLKHAVKLLEKFHKISYRPPRNMNNNIFDNLDMPAKTFIDRYKAQLNTANGKLSPVAIVYYEHEDELRNFAKQFHNKMCSYDVDNDDEMMTVYEAREDARIEGLTNMLQQFDQWVEHANETAKRFNIPASAFMYSGTSYRSIISTLYDLIENATISGNRGIYSGYQLMNIFRDMAQMSLNKGIGNLSQFNRIENDPTLRLFTDEGGQ